MLTLAVLAASLLACSSYPDSAGTDFIFGYIRDADRNISNQKLSVTVLNSNNFECIFSIHYRADYDETKNPLVEKNYLVRATHFVEVPIPSWYGWMYDSGGMQDDKGPWQLITANSTCPVTLIANNHDIATLQEDSYLVLPTTWTKHGNYYTFTLPPASDADQNQHISIIPTLRDVEGVLHVGSDSLAFTAKFVGPTAYFMRITRNSEPMTYKIEADGPILILAGVTCAGNYKACDHAAFMPQPMAKSLCKVERPLTENHPTFVRSSVSDISGSYTDITQGFYVNIPQNCPPQAMTVSVRWGPPPQPYPLSDSQQTPLLSFDPEFGVAVNMYVGIAPINVVRYNDLSNRKEQGAFLETVPSTSQFVTGTSSFFTKNDYDTLEIICTNGCAIFIEGALINRDYFVPIEEIEGVRYSAGNVTIPKKGFHVITQAKDDPYVYCVIGRNGNSMYGYIGAMNMPLYTTLATTTPRPTTKSSTTSALSSKALTEIPTPSPTPSNELTTSSAITMPESTNITVKSTSPTLKTSTRLPITTSSSYSFSSFFLATMTTTGLWLLL